jgi:hypothetical protein
MAAAAEAIQKIMEIMEIAEAWERVIVIKTAAVLAVEADLTLDNLTAAEAAEAAQEWEAGQQDVQQQQMELDHLVVWVDTDLDLEHLVEDRVHRITGLHGLELVAQVETANMELQAAAVAAAAQVVEDLVVAEQEAHKQQITLVDKA